MTLNVPYPQVEINIPRQAPASTKGSECHGQLETQNNNLLTDENNLDRHLTEENTSSLMPNRCVNSNIQWLLSPGLGSSLDSSGNSAAQVCVQQREGSHGPPCQKDYFNKDEKEQMGICRLPSFLLSIPPSFYLFFPSSLSVSSVYTHTHIKLSFAASVHRGVGQST